MFVLSAFDEDPEWTLEKHLATRETSMLRAGIDSRTIRNENASYVDMYHDLKRLTEYRAVEKASVKALELALRRD